MVEMQQRINCTGGHICIADSGGLRVDNEPPHEMPTRETPPSHPVPGCESEGEGDGVRRGPGKCRETHRTESSPTTESYNGVSTSLMAMIVE
ncbi:Exonuclease V subunit beta [Anopheles sinensis]|uniref:Exonuclease V subunit beta n=1 Tax=Anopheles sinensis TaxID=74873 RepID=A0A084VT50_ANOSI|nr:Exonuclease V subunit beta [Anopheles sinensis]